MYKENYFIKPQNEKNKVKIIYKKGYKKRSP